MNTSNMIDKMHLIGQLKVILEMIISQQEKKTKLEQQINKLEKKDKNEQSKSIDQRKNRKASRRLW